MVGASGKDDLAYGVEHLGVRQVLDGVHGG